MLVVSFCIACENNQSEYEDIDRYAVLKANMTVQEIDNVISGIDGLLTEEINAINVSKTDVGGVLTEDAAKEKLAPFLEEGKRMCQVILDDMMRNPMDYPHGAAIDIMNMSDDQIAEFGFIVNEINKKPEIVLWSKWFGCVSYAFGITDGIKQYIINTGKLMTAKTGFMIAKAFAKRTLGWVGAAIAIYDYMKCLESAK